MLHNVNSIEIGGESISIGDEPIQYDLIPMTSEYPFNQTMVLPKDNTSLSSTCGNEINLTNFEIDEDNEWLKFSKNNNEIVLKSFNNYSGLSNIIGVDDNNTYYFINIQNNIVSIQSVIDCDCLYMGFCECLETGIYENTDNSNDRFYIISDSCNKFMIVNVYDFSVSGYVNTMSCDWRYNGKDFKTISNNSFESTTYSYSSNNYIINTYEKTIETPYDFSIISTSRPFGDIEFYEFDGDDNDNDCNTVIIITKENASLRINDNGDTKLFDKAVIQSYNGFNYITCYWPEKNAFYNFDDTGGASSMTFTNKISYNCGIQIDTYKL
jgi:hypothetical protein